MNKKITSLLLVLCSGVGAQEITLSVPGTVEQEEVMFVQEEQDVTKTFSFIAQSKSIDNIKKSLDAGNNVNALLFDGNTLLTLSGMRDSVELLTLAMSHGANYRQSNNNGQNFLHLALKNSNLNYLRVVSTFLNQKQITDVLSKKDKYGATPIHVFYSNFKQNKEVAKWLANYNPKINEKDKNGLTPGHYSVYSGNCSNLNSWLEQGGLIGEKSNFNKSVEDGIFSHCGIFSWLLYYKFLSEEGKFKVKSTCQKLGQSNILAEDQSGKLISQEICN